MHQVINKWDYMNYQMKIFYMKNMLQELKVYVNLENLMNGIELNIGQKEINLDF